MSKLTEVRKALQQNPQIIIVGELEENYLPNRNGFWSHTIDIYVAPKDSGIYNAKKLQDLMMSLTPDIKPNSQDNFHQSDRGISLGKLYYDEKIGSETVHREIVLTDEDMFPSDSFINGTKTISYTVDVNRRIWVRLFPNKIIAAKALDHGIFFISNEDLDQSRNLISRLRHLFK